MSETPEEKNKFYPTLHEDGVQEFEAVIEGLRTKIKKAADDAIGDVYANIAGYIESDAWSNFRQSFMEGFREYGSKNMWASECKTIRQSILREYRSELIADLNKDLVEEVERLKLEIKTILDRRF